MRLLLQERAVAEQRLHHNPMNLDLAERVEAILATKRLTLYQASQQSKLIYGPSSPFFIPHNLYYELHRGTFTPSLYQMAAFSRISGYRLEQWLRAFGFELEDIPRLQILLPAKRTFVLDSFLVEPEASIHWLKDRPGEAKVPPVFPLSQRLIPGSSKRIGSFPWFGNRNFLYAKIGREDTLAFPDLLPGSVVRVRREIRRDKLAAKGSDSAVFLIEHSRGLFCCRLGFPREDLIVPLSNKLPYAQVELQLPREAKLLGIVDGEIRSLLKAEHPDVPEALAKRWAPRQLHQESRLSAFLRNTRNKMDLSLHEASATSARIADLLGDGRYFISVSSLSDYEVLNTPPRHFHKSITLCVLYGLQFRRFLRVSGISDRDVGAESMPEHLTPDSSVFHHPSDDDQASDNGRFVDELVRRCEEIPFFMRRSVATLSGLPDVSLENFYWIGGEANPLHPYLRNGLLMVVNPRRKKPFHFRSQALCQQPLYVLLKRDGSYMCACCSLEGNTLVIHPYPQRFYRPTQFRDHEDAEVVGQIVAIARKLL